MAKVGSSGSLTKLQEGDTAPSSSSAAARRQVLLSVNDELSQLRTQSSSLKADFESKWSMLEGYLMGQLNEQESHLNELKLENKKLRETITLLKTNQKKVFSKWERLIQSVQGLFVPPNGGSLEPSLNWSTFDFPQFQSLIVSATDASKTFLSTIESDARDILAFTNSPMTSSNNNLHPFHPSGSEMDIDSDAELAALLVSPRDPSAESVRLLKAGQPLSHGFSFDSAAAKVAPPVPSYDSNPTTTAKSSSSSSSSSDAPVKSGGEEITRQSSFELFSTYVSLYGQPVDTTKRVETTSQAVNNETKTMATEGVSSKRPFENIAGQQQGGALVRKQRVSEAAEIKEEDRLLPPPFGRMASLGVNNSEGKVETGLPASDLDSADFSLSRLNSLDLMLQSRANSVAEPLISSDPAGDSSSAEKKS